MRRSASGAYAAEGMRVSAAPDGAAPTAELLALDIRVPPSGEALALIEAALTAKITVGFPDAGEQIRLTPIALTSANVFEATQLEDAAGLTRRRAWSGYPGTDQPDRLVIDLAMEALDHAIEKRFVSRIPTNEDQQLLAEIWNATDIPWFAEAPLLTLAGRFGSPALLEKVAARLSSRDPDVQSLAVNALAAITRWDVRRDKDGKPRPLTDVVADYQRECVRNDGPRVVPDSGMPQQRR